MAPDLLLAALIGAGGSLIGGVVGGGFVLLAGRQQFKATRLDRSHQAALTVLSQAGAMHTAVMAWSRNPDAQALFGAFKTFGQGATTQIAVISDGSVGACLKDYADLIDKILEIAGQENAPNLDEAENRQYWTLINAISAHVHGDKPATYEPPPLDDLTALHNWGTEDRPNLPN
jgi:hypothetical protein